MFIILNLKGCPFTARSFTPESLCAQLSAGRCGDGHLELYQWQLDGAFRLIAEASIQFTDDVNSGELIAKAGPVQNGVVRLTYTGEPFDYEDEPRRAIGIRKADGTAV